MNLAEIVPIPLAVAAELITAIAIGVTLERLWQGYWKAPVLAAVHRWDQSLRDWMTRVRAKAVIGLKNRLDDIGHLTPQNARHSNPPH